MFSVTFSCLSYFFALLEILFEVDPNHYFKQCAEIAFFILWGFGLKVFLLKFFWDQEFSGFEVNSIDLIDTFYQHFENLKSHSFFFSVDFV